MTQEVLSLISELYNEKTNFSQIKIREKRLLSTRSSYAKSSVNYEILKKENRKIKRKQSRAGCEDKMGRRKESFLVSLTAPSDVN